MPPSPAIKRRNLSQEKILRAALKIVRKQGISALSIRKLAESLDVTSMAIYRHFDNKDALLSALLDEFIQAAKLLPEDELPWDEWILYVGQRMWEVLADEPDWITLLGRIEMNPEGLGFMMKGLQTLTKAGFSFPDALEAFFAMAHICVGASFVSQGVRQLTAGVQSGRHGEDYFENLQNRFGAIQPLIAAQQVERSLAFLIAGMRQRLPNVAPN